MTRKSAVSILGFVFFVVFATAWLLASSAPAESGAGVMVSSQGGSPVVGFRYVSNDFGEFLWGFTRPVHLWNTGADGEKEWLPFWAHPLREGGILSPFNRGAWRADASLTGGALTADLLLLLLLLNNNDDDDNGHDDGGELDDGGGETDGGTDGDTTDGEQEDDTGRTGK
jgi:hypothetical protein